MKKLPIIGVLIGAVAALFAIKKKRQADDDSEAPTEQTPPST